MLIVSKFHDYYDTAAVYGIDKSVVYKRMTEELELKPRDAMPYPTALSIPKFNLDGHCYIVGFCGELYPMVRLIKSTYGVVTTIYDENFYSAESLLKKLQEEEARLSKWSIWGYNPLRSEKGIREFFHPQNERHLPFKNYFFQYKQPVFSLYYRKTILAPRLKDLRFMKMKDATTAHQEIFQFLSGVLGQPANPMVEIEDKYKQQQHGHDHKYSFRREPTKKK